MADHDMLDNDEPLLVANSLSKSYGRIAACRDVSFSLYSGEVLAIVGESGSGKSTLLQLLSGQLAASGGPVTHPVPGGVTPDLATPRGPRSACLFPPPRGLPHPGPPPGLGRAGCRRAQIGERQRAGG